MSHGRWVGVRGRSATRGVDSTSAEFDKVKHRFNPWRRPEGGGGGVCAPGRRQGIWIQTVGGKSFSFCAGQGRQSASGERSVPRHGKFDRMSLETDEAPWRHLKFVLGQLHSSCGSNKQAKSMASPTQRMPAAGVSIGRRAVGQ